MTHFKKMLTGGALALLATLLFAPMASARPPHFRGGFGWGPGWGWDGGWGAWGAYNPYYYGYGYYPYAPNTGEVKIENAKNFKNAAVYVDGGYVGLVQKNKDIPLRYGDHTIELRAPNGQVFFQQNVNVIPGKTVNLYPNSVLPS